MKQSRKRLWIAVPLFAAVLVAIVVMVLLSGKAPDQSLDELPLPSSSSAVLERPSAGSPADFSAQENLFIAVGVLQNMKFYSSETTGSVLAKVGFIEYTQTVHDKKTKKDQTIFTEAISLSSLKKVAEQKYFENDAVLLRKAERFDGDTPVWSETITPISYDTYAAHYGSVPNSLSNYILSPDTILSAQIVQVGEEYEITVELRAAEAAVNYMRQVKTLSGSSTIPEFHSVKLVLTIGKDWAPVRLVIEENYDISVPIIGKANCSAHLVEVFSYEPQQNPPDSGAFDDFIGGGIKPGDIQDLPDPTEPELSEQIAAIFQKQNSFRTELKLNGKKHVFYVGIDSAQGKLRLQNKELFAEYDGEYIAVSYNGQKLRARAKNLAEAFELVSEKLGIQLNTGDVSLEKLVESLRMEETAGGIRVSLEQKGLSVQAELSNSDGFSIVSAKASLQSGGTKLSVQITPSEFQAYQKADASYRDITDAFGFVKPVLELTEANRWSGTVALQTDSGETYSADVRLIRAQPLEGEALIRMPDGTEVWAAFSGGRIYVSAGAIAVQAEAAELKELFERLEALTGAELSLPELSFPELSAEKVLNGIKNIEASGNRLSFSLRLDETELACRAELAEGKISAIQISGIPVNGKAAVVTVSDIDYSREAGTVEVSGDFISAGELLDFAEAIKRTLEKETYRLGFSAAGAELRINGDLLLKRLSKGFEADVELFVADGALQHQIDAVMKDQKLYCNYNGLKLYAAQESVASIAQVLQELFGIEIPFVDSLFSGEFEHLDVSILEGLGVPKLETSKPVDLLKAIKTLKLSGGCLELTLSGSELFGDEARDLMLTAETAEGMLCRASAAGLRLKDGAPLELELTLKDAGKAFVELPEDAQEYIDVSSLPLFVRDFLKTAEERKFEINGTVNAKMLSIFSFDAPLSMRISAEQDGSVSVYATLEIPYVVGVTKNKTEITLYYADDMIYIRRVRRKVMFYEKDKTDYMKCTPQEFLQDSMKYIRFITNFTDLVQKQIDKAIETGAADERPVRIEEALKNYLYNGEDTYTVLLDGEGLTHDANFGDMELSVTREGELLKRLKFSTSVINMVSLKLDAQLSQSGDSVDMSVIPPNLQELFP